MIKYLRKIPAFQPIGFRQCKALFKQFNYHVYQKGIKITQQGSKSDYIYIVKKGEVRAYMKMFKDKPDFRVKGVKEIFK